MRRANFNLLAPVLMCFLFLFFVQAVSADVSPDINPPSDLTATVVSSSQINLAWTDNSSNETGFIIERKIGNGAYEQIMTVPENATTFADTGLIPNQTYTYRVQADNGADQSFHSNEVEATTAETKPEAPANLSASVESATSIKITWTDNSSNEKGFIIERKTDGGDYSQINTVSANATSYTDMGLSSGIKYYYKVQAYNTAGKSVYSNEVEITTGETTPAAPSNLSISAQSSISIGITWADNSSNEMGFKIERKTSSGNYSQIAVVNADITSYNDTGLFSGVKYYYRVQAYNTAGNSAYSNEIEATTAETMPAAPSNLSVSAQSSTSIRITWADNSNNETGFKIERKTSGGSYSQITIVSANTTSYTDTGLPSNTLYYYRVRAYNLAGNSAYSGEDYATTTGSGSIPAAPSNLSVSAQSSTSIRITWADNSNNETGFKIERKTSNGSYSQITTVSANTTSYTDTGLSSDTRYYYRVRAYNSAGNSAYSGEDYATTNESGSTPRAPSNLSVSAQSSTSIRITWTDNSNNETGFKIERKTTNGSYSQITTVNANTTSYTNTGLSSDTRYYYRVRAYNSAGNSTYSGEDYATTNGSGSTPTAPSNLSASAQSSTSIRITWTDNSNNETGFKIERKTSGGNYSQIATVNANTTSYTNTGLSSDTRYYYRVRAYNSAGDSLYSTEYSVTTSATTNTGATRIIKLTISKSTYYVNNQLKTMDTAPVIRENRTLLPIRYVAEAIGATVNWNNSERKVTVSLDGKVIELWIGKNIARVDGQYVLIDSANLKVTPVIISPGRTMLPLRFITENLGAKVDWDENKKEVTVTYPAP
jgi:transcriptional regulator CtsR